MPRRLPFSRAHADGSMGSCGASIVDCKPLHYGCFPPYRVLAIVRPHLEVRVEACAAGEGRPVDGRRAFNATAGLFGRG